MWKLAYPLVLVTLALTLQGCGASAAASASSAQMQREANLYEIEQIERSWHKATSTHDINLMMSLWAPGAVFNIGTDTYTGKAQIRMFFLTKNKSFKNHWEADTPSYKMRATVNGNKGTLYFQCHYVDPKTAKVGPVVAVDHNVQKIGGRWLIVDATGSTATLSP
jgi:ketosteroid isomerase-like protein